MRQMRHKQGIRWGCAAALAPAILALSGFVDVVPADGGAEVGIADLTALLLSHVLTQGTSKVLVVALALVGVPWMIAGAALTASLVSSRR